MTWFTPRVLAELPDGWEAGVDQVDDIVVLRLEHVVFGGHEFRWRGEIDDLDEDERVDEVLTRLRELGLLEASRAMPELTAAETESLRDAFSVVSAADLPRAGARNVVGLTHSLRQVSDDAVDWAMTSLDLLAEWYELPPEDDEA